MLQGKKTSEITDRKVMSFNYNSSEEKIVMNYESIAGDMMGSFINEQKIDKVFKKVEEKDLRTAFKGSLISALKKV